MHRARELVATNQAEVPPVPRPDPQNAAATNACVHANPCRQPSPPCDTRPYEGLTYTSGVSFFPASLPLPSSLRGHHTGVTRAHSLTNCGHAEPTMLVDIAHAFVGNAHVMSSVQVPVGRVAH